MSPRQKRSLYAVFGLIGIAIASALVIQAMQSNMAYFFSPSQVMNGEIQTGTTFRLGGMVVEDSIDMSANSLKTEFTVTDSAKNVRVSYTGILPDLFKEGQGTVAKGKLGHDGKFYAEEVLAKHDESYMPPEVAEAMKAGEAYRNKAQDAPGYPSKVVPTI
jgi:cytochrome c-type biogenesis protein CcmE